MIAKISILSIGFVLFAFVMAIGQVEISQPLQMSGITNTDRQIRNIADPFDSADLLNTRSVQNQLPVFGIATGQNTLTMNLVPAINSYSPGMVNHFLANAGNTGVTTLNINGVGAFPVRKGATQELDSADIASGQLVSVIFDGSAFQVLSRLNNKCPNGFIKATKDYCIELNERDSVNFWQANRTCHDLNTRLCTFGEWYNACQDFGLGLSDMTSNWEWVDSAANTASNGKVAGPQTSSGNASDDCQLGNQRPTSELQSFRCCYSL